MNPLLWRAFAALGMVGFLLGIAATAVAESSIDASFPTCVESRANSVVKVTLKGESSWALVRLYFHASGQKDDYYMEMRARGDGSYFGIMPRPESGTKALEMYVLARDAGGKPAKAGPVTVNVTSSCKTTLSPEEQRYAQNLVVGNSTADQESKVVAGFLCDGIVSRIDLRGKLTPDDQCRRVLMAAARPGLLVPALAIGAAGAAVVLINRDDKEPNSPDR